MPRKRRSKKPRILVVTPEITYLPAGMGNIASYLTAKGGGLADVSATLVSTLFEKDVDIHVALPHYRKIFNVDVGNFINEELLIYKSKLPEERIHLAEDRAFYYRDYVYDNYEQENNRIALVFQREVINNIIPRVRPDLIHCNDWMTGLVPAISRRMNIPCLFTVHNIHSLRMFMADIENSGIDVAEFWNHLYFDRPPVNYHESRQCNHVDFLASGIFAAHYINTVSPTYLKEIIDGRHDFVSDNFRREFTFKGSAGCAAGILNCPDPSYNPSTDKALVINYDSVSHFDGKRTNKRHLQQVLGLDNVHDAPLFFWPSRLDPIQKGCQLLAEILYDVITKYWEQNLQLVMVANGTFQKHFHAIVGKHKLFTRVAVCDFNENLSRLAYAASDFILMPSLFEPCGLPQMISQLYGSLPVAHDTGGIHDTVVHLDTGQSIGNGLLFEHYDINGLIWAIDQAMSFYGLPKPTKEKQIARVIEESAARFNHRVTASGYVKIYDQMLNRPMISETSS